MGSKKVQKLILFTVPAILSTVLVTIFNAHCLILLVIIVVNAVLVIVF